MRQEHAIRHDLYNQNTPNPYTHDTHNNYTSRYHSINADLDTAIISLPQEKINLFRANFSQLPDSTSLHPDISRKQVSTLTRQTAGEVQTTLEEANQVPIQLYNSQCPSPSEHQS